MKLYHDTLYCVFPSILSLLFLPALRRRPKLIAILLLLPLSYVALCTFVHLNENLDHNSIKFLCLSLLGLAVLLCIRSLELVDSISRVIHIVSSLVLLVAACSLTMLIEMNALLNAAVGLLIGTASIAIGLMADIELQWKQKLDIHSGGGAAYLFPRHSGIILCALMLFGSIPGSLLFLIEDVMLHEISEFSVAGCVLVLMVTGIASVSAYRLFTQNFCGRTLYDLPVALRRDPSRWLGILILLFIVVGLTPALFLK